MPCASASSGSKTSAQLLRQLTISSCLRLFPCAQARLFALTAIRFVKVKLASVIHRADIDGDGELTMDDGMQAYQRAAPVVRKHAALSCGLVGGFITAYSALR